jgi:hypothetical protein
LIAVPEPELVEATGAGFVFAFLPIFAPFPLQASDANADPENNAIIIIIRADFFILASIPVIKATPVPWLRRGASNKSQ